MHCILLLPGDGQGPGPVEAFGRTIGGVTDDVEVVRGDIGFSAYEEYGEVLPYETLDQVGRFGTVVCGPTDDYGDGETIRNPLSMLLSNLDIFARSRTFRTLADGMGTPDVEMTIWGSNINPALDISESENVDGVTIAKFIRSAFYSKMMMAARADMDTKGVDTAVCMARNDMFPQSSKVFYDTFDQHFSDLQESAVHMNITDWLSDVVLNPTDYRFLVVADIYSAVAESIASGLTGGSALAPTKYIGENQSLITLTRDCTATNPLPGIIAAAEVLSDLGMRDESERTLDAVRRALVSHRSVSPESFTDAVLSYL